MTIEIPKAGYDRKKFGEFCKRFGCKLLKHNKGENHLLVIYAEEPINFFWLGANLNFRYKSSIAISVASQIFDEN